MKRKVVVRCLSCLLTGMMLLETPLQVFAEQTNDVVQSGMENQDSTEEPESTDDHTEDKDPSKQADKQDPTDNVGTDQNLPEESNPGEEPGENKNPADEKKTETSDAISEADSKEEGSGDNSADLPKEEEGADQNTQQGPKEDTKDDPVENVPNPEETPAESEEGSETKPEDVPEEAILEGLFVLTGEQFGTEAAYAGDYQELLVAYPEAAEALQDALEQKKSELDVKEMQLAPQIIQDLLNYIVNETSTDCSFLLPLVTYTYVEENVHSIGLSYLSESAQLTLEQKDRSMKHGVELSFTQDNSAEMYRLYRYETSWEERTLVAEIAAKDAKSYTDTEVRDGNEYTYRLMAYQTVEGEQVLCNFSPSVKSEYVLEAPENPQAESMSASVELTWDEVEDATGYEVEVYDKDKGDFTYLEEAKENHYIHEGLESGTVYQYRVRAVYQSQVRAKETTTSSYSDTVEGQTAPAATKVDCTTVGPDSVSLQWEAVPEADGYYVYQDGKQIQDVKELTCQVSGLQPGTEYKFEVSAYADTESKVLEGDRAAAYGMALLPAVNLTVERAAYNQLKLTWQEAAPKASYEIYRKTEGESYQLLQTIADGTAFTWTDDSVKFDTTYQYQIRTVKKVEDRIYTGEYSKEVSGVTTLDAVTIQEVGTSDMQSLKISWNQAPGATGYELYRSTTSGSGFAKIADLPADTTTYQDNGLTIANTYYYQVRAYATEEGKTAYSNYSPEVSGTVKLSEVSNLQVSMTKCNTLQLTWDASPDAKSYEVYYYSSIDSRVRRASNTKKTFYKFTKAKCGVTYYFKVRTWQKVGKVKYYSDYCAEVSGMTVLNGAPTVSIKKITFNSIAIKWTKVKDAKKYEIWYSTTPNGEYQLLKTQGGTSFTHKKITTGDTYYYKVRPIRDYYQGEFSEPISARPGLDELKGLGIARGSKQLTLTWKKLKGAENYVILRSEQENGTYTEVGRTSKVTYTDTGLKDNTKYYYQVYAVAGSYESNRLGPVSETTYEAPAPDAPKPSKPSSDNKKTYYGVDVSSYQERIDWDAVADDDIDFAMIRILTGKGTSNLSVDSRFEYNYKNARAAGIKVGVYRYSYATTVSGARREVEQILDALEGRNLDYPIVLDMEDDSVLNGTTREKRTEIILEYKKRVEEAGYKFALYANKDWLENHIQAKALDGVDIWFARWRSLSSGPGYNGPGNLTMWQYSSKGSVDGISGAVDLDVCYKKY